MKFYMTRHNHRDEAVKVEVGTRGIIMDIIRDKVVMSIGEITMATILETMVIFI